MVKDFDLQEDVDRKAYITNTKKPALKAFFTPASATNAVCHCGQEQENEVKKKEEDDLYTMPVMKDKMTDEAMGASGGAEKSEDYDDVAELKNEPKADSEPGQQSEGEEEKSSNADMLYTVVDKSCKTKK